MSSYGRDIHRSIRPKDNGPGFSGLSVPYLAMGPHREGMPESTTSVFAQDSMALGERWIVAASVRFQRYRQEEGVGLEFVETQNISGSEVLRRFGALYKLGPQLSLYANYATSFVPNLASSPTQGAYYTSADGAMRVLVGTPRQLGVRLRSTF